MSKKMATLFTLITFLVFSLSCYTTKRERVETEASWIGKNVKIVGVMKISGEYIEFDKKSPAKIYEDKIIGTIGTKSVSIPLSEVDLLWIRKVNPFTTSLAVVGGIVATVAVVAIIAAATYEPQPVSSESCPFIYSFDGGKYIFDAEPYGGATCQGLKRTEWCNLEHLSEINGQYRILVTNEVNETQYTDELKLLVVDHPKDTKVVPDILGKIHTISHPVNSIYAYDGKGHTLMPYISENDFKFWLTRIEEKNPENVEDLRDELIFEFPKPEGVANVKLLVNACNTLWGSQALKRYLDLYGSKVSEWYEEVNSSGPAFLRMANTHVREELYSLKIRVETENGWKPKGVIIGGGPLISKDKVYMLDISDVPGDTLRIKLTPPAAFWMINHLAVDYTEDLPVTVTEIGAIKAVDNRSQDVQERLAMRDNDYLVMPKIGDSAELLFKAPPLVSGMKRSFLLKASGYYDIHLKAEGEPNLDLLHRIHTEPGFVVRYAFEEYLKWKKDNIEKAMNN